MLFWYSNNDTYIKTLQNGKDKEEDSHMIHIKKKKLTMVKPLLSRKQGNSDYG